MDSKEEIPSFLPYNDPSYFPRVRLFQSSEQETLQQAQSKWVIDPDSLPSVLWNLAMILIIYYYIFEIGFVFFFGEQIWPSDLTVSGQIGNWVMVLFLSVDVVVYMFKGRYYKGQLIRNLRKLRLRYLKFYFWVDAIFIISIVLPLVTYNFYLNFIKSIIVLKLFKLQLYRQEVVTKIELNNLLRVVFLILLLAFDAFAISHYIACIFYYLDYQVIHSDKYKPHYYRSWLLDGGVYPGNLTQTPWYVQYLYSQGFGMGTLSTLAPGPAPMNPPQALFSIFVMMFCTLFIAFVGDALVQILYADKTKKIQYEDSLFLMNQYFQRNRISSLVTLKIKTYFEFLWHINNRRDLQKEAEVLSRLTPALRQQLVFQLYSPLLVQLKVLKSLPLYTTIATQLLNSIQQLIFIRDQIVYQPNNSYQFFSGIFFGTFENAGFQVFMEIKSTSQRVYFPARISTGFSKFQFFTGFNNRHGLITKGQTKLYFLSREDLLKMFRKGQLRQKYVQIWQQSVIENNLSLIQHRCAICSGVQHLQDRCPQLFPFVDRIFVVNKINHIVMRWQIRKDFQRNDRRQKRIKLKAGKQKPDVLGLCLDELLGLERLIRRAERVQPLTVDKQRQWRLFYPGMNLSAIKEKLLIMRIQQSMYLFNLELFD